MEDKMSYNIVVSNGFDEDRCEAPRLVVDRQYDDHAEVWRDATMLRKFFPVVTIRTLKKIEQFVFEKDECVD